MKSAPTKGGRGVVMKIKRPGLELANTLIDQWRDGSKILWGKRAYASIDRHSWNLVQLREDDLLDWEITLQVKHLVEAG
jgi:hypothetical protein